MRSAMVRMGSMPPVLVCRRSGAGEGRAWCGESVSGGDGPPGNAGPGGWRLLGCGRSARSDPPPSAEPRAGEPSPEPSLLSAPRWWDVAAEPEAGPERR